MPSERVKGILLEKSNFSESEIDAMSDVQCWEWVYDNSVGPDTRKQICFTGFRPTDKGRLKNKANAGDLKVIKSVTKKLNYLCIGPNARPKEIEKARGHKIKIVTEYELNSLITNTVELV